MSDKQDDVDSQSAAEAAAEGEFESSGASVGGGTDDVDPDEGAGTTETDYRWRWLSTIWALAYGLGFPAWVLATGVDVGAAVLSAMLLAWSSTVVYIVGPECVRAWHELRGGGER